MRMLTKVPGQNAMALRHGVLDAREGGDFPGGFPGFVDPDTHFQYLEWRDWDTPLVGGGGGVWEGGLPYQVDGHLRWKADGDGEHATCIDCSGNDCYLNDHSFSFFYPVGTQAKLQSIVKDIEWIKEHHSDGLVSNTKWYYQKPAWGGDGIYLILSNCFNMFPYENALIATKVLLPCRYLEDTGELAFPSAPCRGNRVICRKLDGYVTYRQACTPSRCKFYETAPLATP